LPISNHFPAFFSDYIHTVVIFSIILAVSFCTFATNETLGSPSKVYELLQIAAENYPVGDAAGGSYTTMRSLNGFGFDVVAMVSGRVASIVCFHPRTFKISGQVW
jgi:Na+/proline symporter